MSRKQRIEILLFTACFFAFAYFNQGGGWNQNARFAEVRAMVEEGRFAIDDFMVYQLNPAGDDLEREPLHNAEYTHEGKRYRLCWVDMEWNLEPVGDHPMAPGVEKSAMIEVSCSGDVGYVPWRGQFHPNKPPGTSFLAVPGYWVIYHVERLFGMNPDHWWTLEVNAWLTTVCSVGLLSAIGCVLFFRLCCILSQGDLGASLLTTIAFAFGTTFFPFATIFFDHAATASLLLASLYCLKLGRNSAKPSAWPYVLAGLWAGLAADTNYIAAPAGACLGAYALLGTSNRLLNVRAAALFILGLLPPFLLICYYGWSCFGSPFKLNTDFQNPLFQDASGAWLGMFPVPHSFYDIEVIANVGAMLLFSHYRGFLFFCPFLVFGLYGFYRWIVKREFLAASVVCLCIFLFFFGVNAWFNGYHGGFSAGPRYLVPGIPFLALPAVLAFKRWRVLCVAFAAVAIFLNLLLTATDAQNPVGVGGHARVEGRTEGWGYNLITDYAWPLFVSERAWPLLDDQIKVQLKIEKRRIAKETSDPARQKQQLEQLHKEYIESINRGEPSPFLLGSLEGPVSVNPIGVYEGLFTYTLFPPQSPQCRWASFNIGELLWPQNFWFRSRWSLLPLLVIVTTLCLFAYKQALGEVTRP